MFLFILSLLPLSFDYNNVTRVTIPTPTESFSDITFNEYTIQKKNPSEPYSNQNLIIKKERKSKVIYIFSKKKKNFF